MRKTELEKLIQKLHQDIKKIEIQSPQAPTSNNDILFLIAIIHYSQIKWGVSKSTSYEKFITRSIATEMFELHKDNVSDLFGWIDKLHKHKLLVLNKISKSEFISFLNGIKGELGKLDKKFDNFDYNLIKKWISKIEEWYNKNQNELLNKIITKFKTSKVKNNYQKQLILFSLIVRLITNKSIDKLYKSAKKTKSTKSKFEFINKFSIEKNISTLPFIEEMIGLNKLRNLDTHDKFRPYENSFDINISHILHTIILTSAIILKIMDEIIEKNTHNIK